MKNKAIAITGGFGSLGLATALAAVELAKFDRTLAETQWAQPAKRLALHARGDVIALSEVLAQYASYFGAGVSE